METESSVLSPGMLAFIALANEYCQALESARETGRTEFVARMTRLLPRIYMAAADLPGAAGADDDESAYIEPALDEEFYDAVRASVEVLLGPDDMYLETFEDDMKYSDTPIAVSISECLADIFQVLYNFTEMVREALVPSIPSVLLAVKEDFEVYWSQKVCNVMRPLNHLRYNAPEADGGDGGEAF